MQGTQTAEQNIGKRIANQEAKQKQIKERKNTSKHTHHLKYTDFQFLKILGMGAYGKVELVKRKGVKYALKIIQKRTLARQGKQYQAFIQRQLLRKMNHPGIVQLKTCFQDRANLYFCEQFCEGGDFITFIKNNQNKMTEQLRIFYLAQIVSIIQYFQQIGIVHRDLKPQNILLSEKGHLKLIDFATAEVSQCNIIDNKFKQQLSVQKKTCEDPTSNYDLQQQKSQYLTRQQTMDSVKGQGRWEKKRKATFVGTCYYVPPELLQKQVCYPAADIWALGCIMYQLYYLTPPFDGASQFQIFQKIKNLDFNFPKNDKISEEAMDLIKKLLRKSPEDRLGCNSKEGLTINDLKKHKFFKGIQFQSLYSREVPVLHQQVFSKQEHQRLLKINSKMSQQYFELLKNNQNILIHGAIQKRTFITFNIYYLIIFKNLKILRIKVSQPGKTRQTEIDVYTGLESTRESEKQLEPASLIGDDMFRLLTKQKQYKMKTNDPEKWVTTINKKWRQLHEAKRKMKIQASKYKQVDSENQRGEIQKQCKSISETLRTSNIIIQQ